MMGALSSMVVNPWWKHGNKVTLKNNIGFKYHSWLSLVGSNWAYCFHNGTIGTLAMTLWLRCVYVGCHLWGSSLYVIHNLMTSWSVGPLFCITSLMTTISRRNKYNIYLNALPYASNPKPSYILGQVWGKEEGRGGQWF